MKIGVNTKTAPQAILIPSLPHLPYDHKDHLFYYTVLIFMIIVGLLIIFYITGCVLN